MTILTASSITTPATSGSYNFSVVRDDIINLAMKVIGKLGEAEVPTPEELNDCAKLLNMMVKQWMGKQDFANGLKMWTRTRGDLFLSSTKYQYSLGPTGDNWTNSYVQSTVSASASAGATSLTVASSTGMAINDTLVIQSATGDTQTVTISNIAGNVLTISALSANVNANAYVWDYTAKAQRPIQIVTAILRDINNSDTPLNFMTVEEYEALPTKTQSGNQSLPSGIYYETSLPNGTLYIDCGGLQDVTYHMHIVYLRPVQDLVNPGDALDYPQQWYLALVYGLAKIIAPMFNAPWTKEMEDNFLSALASAREADPDRSAMYFAPNSDGGGWYQ